MSKLLICVTSAVIALLGCVRDSVRTPSGASQQEDATAFAFYNVRVFDGERVIERAHVVVKNGLIAEIQLDPRSAPRIRAAVSVDGAGKTLLPGLIDSHTRIEESGLAEAIALGVTTEIGGIGGIDAPSMIGELKRARSSSLADLRSSGFGATDPRGYHSRRVPTITSADQADTFVESRKSEGSDFLQIVLDSKPFCVPRLPPVDGSAAVPGPICQPAPKLDRHTVSALVKAARERAMLTVAKAGSLDDARFAIECGVDGLVHHFSSEPNPAFVSLVAAQRAFVVPMLAAGECDGGRAGQLATDQRLAAYLYPRSRDTLRRAGAFGRDERCVPSTRTVSQLRRSGVMILAGSNASMSAGTAHGATMHDELRLLVEAGFSPKEALIAATSAPAAAFGLADRGSVAVGKRADLILVQGDPTIDISTTRNILGVWKEGVQVDRKAQEAAVAEADAEETAAEEEGIPIDAE